MSNYFKNFTDTIKRYHTCIFDTIEKLIMHTCRISTYTFLFSLAAGVCFLIGRSYFHHTSGVVCAREVKVHLNRAPAPSGGDVIVVQVIVEKQVVLDAQEINHIPAGVRCECVSVCI